MSSPLRKAEVAVTDPVTSIWRQISIGTTPRDKIIPTLKEHGMNVSDWSADIMKQDAFTVVQEEEQIDLVRVSVRELGFDKATRYDAICQCANERGLELCPPEVGLQLRLQYLDQPLDEWLIIAIEAIRGADGALNVFYVGHDDGGLWLRSYCGGPDNLWNPGHRFVFRARKQPSNA